MKTKQQTTTNTLLAIILILVLCIALYIGLTDYQSYQKKHAGSIEEYKQTMAESPSGLGYGILGDGATGKQIGYTLKDGTKKYCDFTGYEDIHSKADTETIP